MESVTARHLGPLLVALALAAPGCTGDDATTAASATTSSTGATGSSTSATGSDATGSGSESSTGAIECDAVPDDVAALEACGLPSACGTLYDYANAGQSCVGPLEDGSPYNMNELCALDRLATRTPGLLHASWTCPDVVTDRYIYIVGDVAYVTSESGGPCFGCPCDWSSSWSSVQRCELRPAADFVACQEAADTASRVACMDPTMWFVACQDAPPACQP